MTPHRKLKFFKTPGDVILFFRLFSDVLKIKLLSRKMPLKHFLHRFASGGKTREDVSRIEHVLRFSDFLVYGLFRCKRPCFYRSLLLYRHLTMIGIELKIAFGVRHSLSGLKGHAWLIRNGGPVFYHGEPVERYQIVLIYP
jgi:hypothetical protein